MNSRSPRSAAFTLIELLTVIAIIGILAAIIVPTVARARDQARKSQSTSNLRQWAAALHLHLADNKNLLPLRGPADRPTWTQVSATSADALRAWYNVLPPFVGERPLRDLATASERARLYADDTIHRDPRAQFTEARKNAAQPAFSYSWNSQLNNSRSGAGNLPTSTPQPFSRFPDPSRTVIFIEGWSCDADKGPHISSQSENADSGRAYGRAKHISYRSNGVASLAFLDGSVRGYRSAELDRGDDVTNENKVVFFWGVQ